MCQARRTWTRPSRLDCWLVGAVLLGGTVLGGTVLVQRGRSPALAPQLIQAEVRGSSLSRTLPPGNRVLLEPGYYQRHAVGRDQVVAFRVPGQTSPVIKIAKGLPGDELALVEREGKRMLEINGRALVNADAEPYHLSLASHRLLSLYVRDYQGRIPADAYLLLGDSPGGSFDSTRLGLIHRSDLIARVWPAGVAVSLQSSARAQPDHHRGT